MRLSPVTAAVAQLVERVLGKDEVMGSNPISSFEPEERIVVRSGGPMRRADMVCVRLLVISSMTHFEMQV